MKGCAGSFDNKTSDVSLDAGLLPSLPHSNRTFLPNPHPRKDDHVPAKPAVLSHVDLLAELRAFGAVLQGGVERVGARVETAIRAHEGSGADSDGAGIDEGGVEVEEDAGAEFDVAAIVDMGWGRSSRVQRRRVRRLLLLSALVGAKGWGLRLCCLAVRKGNG